MTLSATNFVNKGPVLHNDLLQFYNLFVGVMVDQPVTFRNTLVVGGSQGATTVPLKLYGAVGQIGDLLDLYVDPSQAQPGFGFGALGNFAWGPGGVAPQDTFMSRVALQNGHVSDTAGLLIRPYLEVAGIISGQQYQFPNGTVLSSPAAFSLSINQDLTVQRFLVVNSAVGIGIAPAANILLTLAGSATAIGTVAYGLLDEANLIAAANADSLQGASISPTFNGGGHSNIVSYGLVVTAPAVSNTPGASTGTGIWVNSPVGNSGGTNRGVYVSAPSGGTANIGLEVGGGAPGLQVDAGGAVINGTPAQSTVLNIAGGATTYGLIVNPTLTAASIATAYIVPTINSTVTGNADVIAAALNTQAAAFTLASVNGLHVFSPVKGAGSAIGTANGINVDAQTAGSTTNRGIYVGTPSGGATNIGVQIAGGGPALQIDTGDAHINPPGILSLGTALVSPGTNVGKSADTVYLSNHAFVFFDLGVGHIVTCQSLIQTSDPQAKSSMSVMLDTDCMTMVRNPGLQVQSYTIDSPAGGSPPAEGPRPTATDIGFDATQVNTYANQFAALNAGGAPVAVNYANMSAALWGALRNLDARCRAFGIPA
jgi:hypothetical protein